MLRECEFIQINTLPNPQQGRLSAVAVDLPPREYALLRHRDRHETVAQETLVAQLTEATNAVSL